jgi:hypothetical protein
MFLVQSWKVTGSVHLVTVIFIVMHGYALYPVSCNYLFEGHGIFILKLQYIYHQVKGRVLEGIELVMLNGMLFYFVMISFCYLSSMLKSVRLMLSTFLALISASQSLFVVMPA